MVMTVMAPSGHCVSICATVRVFLRTFCVHGDSVGLPFLAIPATASMQTATSDVALAFAITF
jgi:hypothetical protein